jgi:DUF438 domain-containing protein
LRAIRNDKELFADTAIARIGHLHGTDATVGTEDRLAHVRYIALIDLDDNFEGRIAILADEFTRIRRFEV